MKIQLSTKIQKCKQIRIFLKKSLANQNALKNNFQNIELIFITKYEFYQDSCDFGQFRTSYLCLGQERVIFSTLIGKNVWYNHWTKKLMRTEILHFLIVPTFHTASDNLHMRKSKLFSRNSGVESSSKKLGIYLSSF